MSENFNPSSEKTASRILLVDDDVALCSLMADFFRENDIELEVAHDGGRGLAKALEGRHELVILDVMLPMLDGFEVLRQVRRRSQVPIIMLTARTEEQDRVFGLEAGADDYLPKPFRPRELLARIRAVLRRTGQVSGAAPAVVEAGALRLNPATREAWIGERPLSLTGFEFEILDVLSRSAGRVVSRDELSAVLYQRQATPYERSLDVHIHHLRQKLGDDCTIRTVRGVGYLFAAGEA